jgi:hypothetical protein
MSATPETQYPTAITADVPNLAHSRVADGATSQIARVGAGKGDDQNWRAAVGRRLTECEEQLQRLESARAYLTHMLMCPSDHPADRRCGCR